MLVLAGLPPAASMQRTKAALDQLDQAAFAHPAFFDNITVTGFDVQTGGQRSNAGVSFVLLKDWSERHDPGLSADAVAGALLGAGVRHQGRLRLRAVAAGRRRHVERGRLRGLRAVALERLRGARAGDADADRRCRSSAPSSAGRTSPRRTRRRCRASMWRSTSRKPSCCDVNLDDVNVTLQSTFGAFYVNDFNRDGRVYRVQMQSDAQFRAHPEDLRDVSVRSADGAMIPLTAIATVEQVTGPDFIERFNLFPSARLSGEPAPGYSSGQALAAMEEVAAEVLPDGYTLAWSGQSYQEKTSGQNTLGDLRARGADGVPDPRGAVRAPHAAVRGDPRGAVRGVRRVPRGVAARSLQRSVPADRARDARRPRGEERDPDRRVRGAHASRGHGAASKRPSRRRGCASGRSS